MSIDTSIEDALTRTADTAAKRDERENEKAKGGAPSSGLAGMLWFTGWLFTIGFMHLVWWKALLALIAWPYFLGLALHP